MVHLSTNDLKEVLDLNNDILGCRTLDELRTTAMASMRRVLDADTSVFFRVTGSKGNRCIDRGLAYGADDKALDSYQAHYKDMDPFLSRALNEKYSHRAPVVVSDRLINYSSFEHTEFYNDFFRPNSVHSVMGVTLHAGTQTIGLLAVHRPKHALRFNQRDQTKAQMAVAGLSAALQRVLALEQVNERNWILDTLVPELPCEGVMVLDSELNLVFSDAHARELLNAVPGKRLGPVAIPEAVDRVCKKLMQEPDKSNNSPMSRIELDLRGTNKLGARVRLASAGASGYRFVVYIEKQPPPFFNDYKLKNLGLTHREIDIVHLVGVGLTNIQVADNLCISERTVQNHLRSIYTKMGVHNRTSLLYHLIADA